MASARRGRSRFGSVDGFIRLLAPVALAAPPCGELLFVEDGFADHVVFAGPRAQVEQPAALSAERELWMEIGIGGGLADGAAVLHGPSLSQNAQGRSGGDAVELFLRLGGPGPA